MAPLRVAYFCWESLHSVRVGGLAPAVTHLAETIARHHEVHYFTRGPGPDRTIDGVHYHFAQPEGHDLISYCRDMSAKALSRFREADSPPFDLVHFHDWHFIDALGELSGRRTVLTFHSTEYGRNGGNFGTSPEFAYISRMEREGCARATQLTTVSHHTKTEIVWLYGVPAEKITVVPNGIYPDAYRLPVDPGQVKKEYGIHPLAPVALFVGRLVYQKGADILADAVPLVLRRRGDVQFIVVGDGEMRPWLEERCRSLPVHFTGFIPDAEYLRLLNACDVVVIPSRNEPFGLVLTEAWSAGRCVVATDVGGPAENIENFVDGIKVPVRADSLAWGSPTSSRTP
ncbi:MAG: glycosyltransferase family 4 protein [Methanolinea sp.]